MLPPGSHEVLSCGSLWAEQNYGNPNPSFLVFEWTVPASCEEHPQEQCHMREPTPGQEQGPLWELVRREGMCRGWEGPAPSTGGHCHLRLYHRGSLSQAFPALSIRIKCPWRGDGDCLPQHSRSRHPSFCDSSASLLPQYNPPPLSDWDLATLFPGLPGAQRAQGTKGAFNTHTYASEY